MSKLRVHIDDAPLHSGHAIRGMGFYTRNLINSLTNHGHINLTSLTEADIVHFPYFDLFSNTLKKPRNKKLVVTVPDVIPLIYPKVYKPGIKGKLAFSQQRSTLKQADAIITISETSKKDIVRLLDIPHEKIHVTYLGPGNRIVDTNAKVSLDHKYALYIGDINWNKNINNFVKALNKLDMHGVIVGKQAKELVDNPDSFDFGHPQLAHLRELYVLLTTSKNIHVMGYLEEDMLMSVTKGASLYCQPSYYEGFGLPLLEAMQVGIPVVSSRTQALVEIADRAAHYFNPYSADDMADALSKVMDDKSLRAELKKQGSERIKTFSWEETAKTSIKAYETI